MIDGVLITPLDVIETAGGDVMHAIKKNDNGFVGFGEAYYSNVEFESIKAFQLQGFAQRLDNIVLPTAV